jgi:hypothetical protein
MDDIITADEEAKLFSKLLFSSEPFHFDHLSKRVKKALFLKRDPELLTSLFNVLQELSKRAIHNPDPYVNIFIGRILALYPFLEPTNTLDVPVFIQGRWQIVPYTVERWELSPKILGSPLTAFGLTSPAFPSLFLLMGGAFPSISGHLLSLWTDFVPLTSVGEAAFQLFAKNRIQTWLEKQSEPIRIYGQSLGAAFALHTVCAFGGKIEEVHAFCPPALYARTIKRFQGNAQVHLYLQKNDIVHLVGRGFHPQWKWHLIESKKPQSPFFAHIRVVPALSTFTVSEKEPSRGLFPFFTVMHTLLSLPIFCITSLILLGKMLMIGILSHTFKLNNNSFL